MWSQNKNVNVISWITHVFWLVLFYELLEDWRIDDVTINIFYLLLYYIKQRDSILWATIGLFSNIAKDVKSGENISDTLGCASLDTFLFHHICHPLWPITEEMHGGMESVSQFSLKIRRGKRKNFNSVKLSCY